MPTSPYRVRLIDAVLDETFPGLAAIMLTEPRACGKTTTAARRAASILRLDDPAQARAFATAPDSVLASHPTPLLIDEWQEVPESLGAIKRAVDTGSGGGRFLITGSVRARRTHETRPGTGRVVPLRMYGLTQGEIEAHLPRRGFLDKCFDTSAFDTVTMPDAPNLPDYIDMAVRGGFPEAITMTERQRGFWFPGYVDQLVHRDVAALAEVRSPERLTALLQATAMSSAGTPALTTLATASGIDTTTARAYLDLLDDLRVVERLPAWRSNRLKRLVKQPKLHLVDPA